MRQHLAHKAVRARIKRAAQVKKISAITFPAIYHQSKLTLSINEYGAWSSYPMNPEDLKPKKLITDMNLVRFIIRTISKCEEVSSQDIFSPRRNQTITRARQMCMYFAYEFTSWSFPQIGRYFEDRDHTTAMHAKTRILQLCHLDIEICQRVARYEAVIANCKQYGLPVNAAPRPLTASDPTVKPIPA